VDEGKKIAIVFQRHVVARSSEMERPRRRWQNQAR